MSLACLSLKPIKHAERKNASGAWRPTPRNATGSHRRWQMAEMLVLGSFLLLQSSVSAFVSPSPQQLSYKETFVWSSTSGTLADPSSEPSRTATLGFLSFDLDDTLFPINEVVDDANDAMVQRMQELGIPTTTPEFLDTTREIRRQLDQPVTYSTLRKLAISQEVGKHTPMDSRSSGNEDIGSEKHSGIVEECFDAWLEERHAAAERYLFSEAIKSLSVLKENYPDACIAAITNGRGNPLFMPNTLEPFFDFCVSGEDDGVFPRRKPHAGIYEESLRRYNELYPHHQDGDGHRIWCHVGDCLANDVGASTAVGAHAVWLYGDEESVEASQLASADSTPKWSTATRDEQEKRAQLTSEGREKVAVRISW
jgi:FMN phosphatase YigB (HAD superfamily)